MMIQTLIVILFVTIFGIVECRWDLVWADEFNGNNLDESKWHYEEGCSGWGNNELQCYTVRRKENAKVQNGHLVITARVEKWKDKQFTSARLLGKQGWTFGKMEARAWMPEGKHLWPAIWMMPLESKYGGWAASGEIDIMEYRGQRTHQTLGTLHYGGAWPNNIYSGSGEKNFQQDFSKGWHTFHIEWNPTSVSWFVDGKKYHTENINKMMWSKKGKNPYTKNGQPFDQKFRWILNIAVGGNFFPPNIYGNQVTPQEAKGWRKATMEIDYVRVYQWKN